MKKDQKNVHVYVIDHCSLSPEEAIRRYAIRWGIEQIRQDLKENGNMLAFLRICLFIEETLLMNNSLYRQ